MGILDSATKKAKEAIETSVSAEAANKLADSISTIGQRINTEENQKKMEILQEKKDEIRNNIIKKKDDLIDDIKNKKATTSSNHSILVMKRENIKKTPNWRSEYYDHTDFELAFYDKENELQFRAVGLNDRHKQIITIYDLNDVEVGVVKEKRVAWRMPSITTEYEPADFDIFLRGKHLGLVQTTSIIKGSMMKVSFNGWRLKWLPGGCSIVDSQNEFIASINLKISDWSKQYILEFHNSIDPVLIVLLAVVIRARETRIDRKTLNSSSFYAEG